MIRNVMNMLGVAPPPPPPPPPTYGPTYAPMRRKEEGKLAIIAGIFLLLQCFIGFGYGIFILWIIMTIPAELAQYAIGFLGLGWGCVIIPILFWGIFPVLGAVYCLKRTHWPMALICSILSWNIIAIICVALGKEEFA